MGAANKAGKSQARPHDHLLSSPMGIHRDVGPAGIFYSLFGLAWVIWGLLGDLRRAEGFSHHCISSWFRSKAFAQVPGANPRAFWKDVVFKHLVVPSSEGKTNTDRVLMTRTPNKKLCSRVCEL